VYCTSFTTTYAHEVCNLSLWMSWFFYVGFWLNFLWPQPFIRSEDNWFFFVSFLLSIYNSNESIDLVHGKSKFFWWSSERIRIIDKKGIFVGPPSAVCRLSAHFVIHITLFPFKLDTSTFQVKVSALNLGPIGSPYKIVNRKSSCGYVTHFFHWNFGNLLIFNCRLLRFPESKFMSTILIRTTQPILSSFWI
jgi:hypothetical protein